MNKRMKPIVLANRVIMAECRRRQIPYVNMDQAAGSLAAALSINVAGMPRREIRFLLQEKISGVQVRRPKETPPKPHWTDNHQKSDSPTQAMINEFYASWPWKKLSYQVKLERGRTCECCGARAPKIVIHTDHIKPIRKYWHLRFDRTNLQVLCEDCNRGKASHDETDFRALNAQQAPADLELSPEEEARMEMISDQLHLN